MRVVIIGGGVIGLCSAYYLSKQGYKVVIVERNDITDGCSFGNMEYVSPSHFIPLATPGIVSQGIKWMLKSSSPFYIKPRLNWDLLSWGMTFWKNSNAKNVEANAPHLNDLLQLTRHLMNNLKNELGDSFSMMEKGCWMLYRNEKTGDHEKHLAEQASKYGLKTMICNPQQVQDLEPEVEVNVAGGVLYIDDAHVDPSKFMEVLYSYLKRSGVEFWLNTEVKGFERNNGKITSIITNKGDLICDEVILATGSWLPDVSKMLKIKILMQPGKGYSFSYNNLEKNLQHPSILVDDRTATTPIDRWLRIGGTMELSGHSDNILSSRVMAIYKAFKKYYPTLNIAAPQPEKAWYGYRPVTPDGLPYIGRHHKYNNLTYAGGHAMLGMSAAAGTGELIGEIISGKNTTIDINAFSPERFN